jgi:thioesterase domain-containing protein
VAAAYLRALREVQPSGPYLLGGWSSGAVIAFELAAQLQAQGETVARLVVADAPAPQTQPRPGDVTVLLWFLEDTAPGFDAGLVSPGVLGELAAAPPARRLERALALAREQGSDPGGLDAAAAATALGVFRRVIAACASYQARPAAAPITVVRAADGQVAEFARHPCATAADWGWARLAGAGTDVVTVPGTHHTMLSEANVTAVADVLNGVTPEADHARS